MMVTRRGFESNADRTIALSPARIPSKRRFTVRLTASRSGEGIRETSTFVSVMAREASSRLTMVSAWGESGRSAVAGTRTHEESAARAAAARMIGRASASELIFIWVAGGRMTELHIRTGFTSESCDTVSNGVQ